MLAYGSQYTKVEDQNVLPLKTTCRYREKLFRKFALLIRKKEEEKKEKKGKKIYIKESQYEQRKIGVIDEY